MSRYTIRYRCDAPAGTSLIIEDGQGTAYLFSDGLLQLRLGGEGACSRLATLLRRHAPWAVVPEVPAYTLEELRRLTQTPAPNAGDDKPCHGVVVGGLTSVTILRLGGGWGTGHLHAGRVPRVTDG